MKLKPIIVAASIVFAATSATEVYCQSMSKSKREMLEATLRTYNQLINENAGDYQTLYRRANLYYNHNSYGQALTDINEAITKAPASDKAFMLDCYSLRGGIYERIGHYNEAIADYRKANKLDPSNYATLYQLANLEFLAGEYEAAKTSYTALRRLNPRSQEAYFGLARVAVKQGDLTTANKLMSEGTEINPTGAITFMRQGTTYKMMGDNSSAVDAYATALSIDTRVLTSALREISQMADTDYQAVMTGLQRAIEKSPRNGAYYYIRAAIAMNHYKYRQALTDFTYMVDNNLMATAMVYTDMAECLYNLGDYVKATEMCDMAIGSSSDNRDAYVMKSRVKAAQGAWKAALENSEKAVAKDADFAPAQMAKALAQEGMKLYPEANITMSKAIEINRANPLYYFERAYLIINGMKLPNQAPSFYDDVLRLKNAPEGVLSLQGFADLMLGNTEAADSWMNNLSDNTPDPDGIIAYYATCFWAMRGNDDKALEMMQRALKAGYSSYHNFTLATDGGINCAAIRDDARFKALLEQYASLFKL